MQATHIPVLAQEVLELLNPQLGDTVIDCTVGLGGHSTLFAKAIGPKGTLICIDTDKDNLDIAQEKLANYECTLQCIHANFIDLLTLQLPKAQCIFADLGVSSPHFDDAKRGFSFRLDGPLDLRLDRSTGSTVAELLHSIDETSLRKILEQYGELSRPIALTKCLLETKPKTTLALRAVIDKVYTFKAKKYYAQVFQALRIAVNKELDAVQCLVDSVDMLQPNGKMGIISFHSLEDRIVKQTFKALSTSDKDSYTGASLENAQYELITKKCITPTEQEVLQNPRSRSAKFRVLKRR